MEDTEGRLNNGQSYLTKAKLLNILDNLALDIRKGVVRLTSIAGGGHIGGGLSCVDILVALYFYVLNIRPSEPAWKERDRFILSKGHGAIAFFPVLGKVGFFPEESLETFNKLDSAFGMHPDMHRVPGVEISTGSLGHGLSISVGIALGARLKKAKWKIYCLLGDGELQEGSVWEAIMSASHYKLSNLVAIVDRNKLQIDGPTEKIMSLEPLVQKWQSFNWNVKEIDGHNMEEIIDTFESLKGYVSEYPTVIIAHTIKGKGVNFMENNPAWHYGGVDKEKVEEIFKEIEEKRKYIGR